MGRTVLIPASDLGVPEFDEDVAIIACGGKGGSEKHHVAQCRVGACRHLQLCPGAPVKAAIRLWHHTPRIVHHQDCPVLKLKKIARFDLIGAIGEAAGEIGTAGQDLRAPVCADCFSSGDREQRPARAPACVEFGCGSISARIEQTRVRRGWPGDSGAPNVVMSGHSALMGNLSVEQCQVNLQRPDPVRLCCLDIT